MFLPSSTHFKILEVLLSYLNTTMAHKTRQLVNPPTLFKVHTCKCMTKRMSRNPYTSDTSPIFYINKKLFNAIRSHWLTITINKNTVLILVCWFAIMINILPKLFCDLGRNADLSFFLTFPKDSDMILKGILCTQSTKLRNFHLCPRHSNASKHRQAWRVQRPSKSDDDLPHDRDGRQRDNDQVHVDSNPHSDQ